MTASATYATHPVGEIRAEHAHAAALVVDDRACEPGVRAVCLDCGGLFAPCTQTEVSVADIKAGRWRCVGCRGGAS